jgi:hypothetical protein
VVGVAVGELVGFPDVGEVVVSGVVVDVGAALTLKLILVDCVMPAAVPLTASA